MDHRAGLHSAENRNISCHCRESNIDSSAVQPTASSLHRLTYTKNNTARETTCSFQVHCNVNTIAITNTRPPILFCDWRKCCEFFYERQSGFYIAGVSAVKTASYPPPRLTEYGMFSLGLLVLRLTLGERDKSSL